MTFPVYIELFGLHIHSHLLFEMLAYSIGFQLYLRTRDRWKHPVLPMEQNLWIIVGCIFGALAGSKLLNILDMPIEYWKHRTDFLYLIEGKTIVGGLIGDGIVRHPTQLYEAIFLLAFGVYLFYRIRQPYLNGYIFRLYIFAYLLFRFLVEFIKPRFDPYLGLSMIQIASLAGAVYCVWLIRNLAAASIEQPEYREADR